MRKDVNVLFRQTAMPIGKTVKLRVWNVAMLRVWQQPCCLQSQKGLYVFYALMANWKRHESVAMELKPQNAADFSFHRTTCAMHSAHCESNSDTFLGLWLPHSQNLQFTLFLWKGNLLANFVLILLLGLAINERLFNFKLNWTKFSHSGLFICSKFVKQSYVYKDDEVILTLT